MQAFEYTTVDRILARLDRELRNTEFHESDVIEWIGEAMEFLRVEPLQEESIAFMEVKNYHADIPFGFQLVIQIARDTDWSSTNSCTCETVTEEATSTEENTSSSPCESIITDCRGNILTEHEIAYYRPYFDLQWEYAPWVNSPYYQQRFVPVRLANHTFFNTLVMKERDESVYRYSSDEYTIVGTTEKKLRFSFEEGYVAMAFLRNVLDSNTGYPLVPDQISFITAITYYVKWKIAEWLSFSGRRGFDSLMQDNERKWLKYASQAKNYAKMPKSLDDYQDLLEQTHYLIPRHRRYYGYFGKLGRYENRVFNDPDYRKKLVQYYVP